MAEPHAVRYTTELLRKGFCIAPDLLPGSALAALESDLERTFAATPFGQGHFYGTSTKRFGRLAARSLHAEALILEPTIMAIADAILSGACDRIQLNVAQAIEIHPGADEQFPHRDQDMWGGTKGEHEYLLNVMWPLTSFTDANGATRMYPRTHLADPQGLEDCGEPVAMACEPGSAICFLGSTLHGAGANVTQMVRRGVIIGYSLGWLKPYENLWLAYPPAVARTFSPELAALAGYAQHRPNLGNYEGQCPSILLGDDVPAHIGAIDALRPDQMVMMQDYNRTHRSDR